jgi:methylphosphotriester-DNA--protein-cysteine methyltransferase
MATARMSRRLPRESVSAHDISLDCSPSISAATPSQVAKTARVQRAKRLLDGTDLPMTEVALRAGFASLRRFNAVFAEVYRRSPTDIRQARRSVHRP